MALCGTQGHFPGLWMRERLGLCSEPAPQVGLLPLQPLGIQASAAVGLCHLVTGMSRLTHRLQVAEKSATVYQGRLSSGTSWDLGARDGSVCAQPLPSSQPG